MATDYVDEVPYIRQFVSELAPPNLRIAAALNGLPVPPADDFDYCELGCAHGDTLCALAAAHPDARFIGVDLMAAHIATAKKLARDGALENVGFLERDFGDLIDDDTIGELDFVVAHGVLSWISPEKRAQLLAFARAKLKPGGILFVSYNAMPGWSAVEPLRQLLMAPVVDPSAGVLERARQGLAFAQSLSGAEYFAKNPSAASMLDTMARGGLAYMVHEYFHEHWSPLYFARLAWDMRACDLYFVGVLPLFLNFRDMAIPESLDSVFARMTDRATFESMKDFAVNELFRFDLYVRGDAIRSTEATARFLDATSWVARSHGAPAKRTVALPHRSVSLEGPVFDALFDALGAGAITIPSLMARPAFGVFGIEKVRAAMVKLIVADVVLPVATPLGPAPVATDRRFRVLSSYNAMMLRRLGDEAPTVLASTVAGTAFPISGLDGMAIRALTESPPEERAEWIRELVGRNVLRLRVGERVVEDRNEQEATIASAIDRLVTEQLPKLVELGIVAPV